jgi:membrane protein YdbS with pleckstrin-like domain
VQWTAEALVWALPLLLVASAVASGVESPGWAAPAVLGAAILAAALGVLAVPQLRWRRWRYEVREREVDLRRGTVTVVRTIVPMARIQHVATHRTFFSQVFSTAELALHTAGGAVHIPALDEPVAAGLRDRIAELARTPDEDDERAALPAA